MANELIQAVTARYRMPLVARGRLQSSETRRFVSRVLGRWDRESEWLEEHLRSLGATATEAGDSAGVAARSGGARVGPQAPARAEGKAAVPGRDGPTEPPRREAEEVRESESAVLDRIFGPLQTFQDRRMAISEGLGDEDEVRRRGEQEWMRRGF